jgi:hypothetical protein
MSSYTPVQAGGVPAVANVVAYSAGPPVTPQSPDPRPLITADDYARITGDAATDSALVTAALAEVLDDTARMCNRTWLYGQYTELLYLYKNGMVFPSATPIDVGQPILAGSEVFDPHGGVNSESVVQGAGVWVGWFTPLPWMPVWTGVIPPQTEITYWGGFVETTVPEKLKRIWARVAWYYLHPVLLPGLPGGSKSASAGGISVSGDLSIVTASDPQLKRDLRRWTRRQARAWQS